MANKKEMYIKGIIKKIRETENLSDSKKIKALQEIYNDVYVHYKLDNDVVPAKIMNEINSYLPKNAELEKPKLPDLSYSAFTILPWVKQKQDAENAKRINLFAEVEQIKEPKKVLAKYIEMLEDAVRKKEKPNESLLHILRTRFNNIDNEWGLHINIGPINYQRGIKNVIQQLKDRISFMEFLSSKYSTLYGKNQVLIKNPTNLALITKQKETLKLNGQWNYNSEYCKWLLDMELDIAEAVSENAYAAVRERQKMERVEAANAKRKSAEEAEKAAARRKREEDEFYASGRRIDPRDPRTL